MPIYEYRCCDCEQIFEEWQKGFEDKDVPCPVCGHKAKRLISNTAFVLKGTGWYVTDYCRSNSSGNAAAGANGSNGTNGASKAADTADAAPAKPATESKPAATAESSAS
jgi:putative FmdB family regulatory protein